MADDPSKTIVDALAALTRSIESISRQTGRTTRDLGDFFETLGDASEKVKELVYKCRDLAKNSSDARRGLDEFKRGVGELGLDGAKAAKATSIFRDSLKSIGGELNILNMSFRELKQKMDGGIVSMNDLGKAVTGQFANMRYGWYSAALDFAKGLEQVDIQTRRATIGLMGIGGGMMGGAAGLGVRQYQPGAEMQHAAGQAIGALMLMGKTSEQAANEIRNMTQVFGANFMGMGALLSMQATKIASAFALAAGVSEEVAKSATVNLIMKFGMSAERAAATLVGFDKAARSTGMSTQNYTAWVTELSQSTRTYTTDINFSQAVVRRFSKELQEGQVSVQQFAQMATALRQADFGRQAGILALATQLGVRTGAPAGTSPLGAIGMVGERGREAQMLRIQVETMRALSRQIAGPGANQREQMGAMRLAAQEFPALRGLQNLSNDTMKEVLNGVVDLGRIQKEIAEAAPPDPAKQMDTLIGVATGIGTSIMPLAEAIQKTIVADAFRVTFALPAKVGQEGERIAARTRTLHEQERPIAQLSGRERMEAMSRLKIGKQHREAEVAGLVAQGVSRPEAERYAIGKAEAERMGVEFAPPVAAMAATNMRAQSRGEVPSFSAGKSTGTAPGGGTPGSINIQIGLTGDDTDGLVRRTAEELSKALRSQKAKGRS